MVNRISVPLNVMVFKTCSGSMSSLNLNPKTGLTVTTSLKLFGGKVSTMRFELVMKVCLNSVCKESPLSAREPAATVSVYFVDKANVPENLRSRLFSF